MLFHKLVNKYGNKIIYTELFGTLVHASGKW